jgi:DNA-directed RNA polymerase specialized sigma24 family protein
MLKLLKSAPQPRNHEDLFVERYAQLLKWALQLTSGDRGLAEDLVHNAFIQFTLTAPDLNGIQNLDGYLYGVLRFLHLSQMRRATRSRLQQLSIVDYDSAETGLRVISPREHIEVQDELRRICQYACARKETSKAGSVLILRFFHGYYPSEIVRVLRLARKVADARLQVARREAKMFVAGSGRLTFLKGVSVPDLLPANPSPTTEGCLADLRRTVFSSRRGECLSRERLEELYQSEAGAGIDRQTSAHIVSCETCLDQVNTLLDLPLLSTRFPTDALGKDQGSRRGPSDGSGGSSGGGPPDGGGAVAGSVETSKRRAREVFEHRPKELHIAVNGYIQASQKINAEVNEQTLDLNQGDSVSFVEVFSEQDARLLLFTVDEPPPSGPYEQSRRVQFSDGRSLEATFAFTNPWPTLHVVYLDPLLASESANESLETESLMLTSDDKQAESQRDPAKLDESHSKPTARKTENFLSRSIAWLAVWLRAFDCGFFLKPGSVTALLALMLVAVLMFVAKRQPVTTLTAAALLDQAGKQEDIIAARTDIALHRTIRLEERSAAGATLSQRKIEIWQSAEKGIVARREYDERGTLVAGDWRRRDGVQTIYHHGARPQLQFGNPQSATRSFENVWQWTPSAREFSAVAVNNAQARVEEIGSTYVLTYENGDQGGRNQGFVRATLSLTKADLHASEATLILRQGDEQHEFRFVETSFEQPLANSVAPAVFEPEPELLSSAKTEPTNTKPETATVTPGPQPPSPVTASADLEVEVLRLLHQAGADLGEQISVTRTPEGQLQIQGVVETNERKNELLRALDSVKSNPAVKVQINSAAEALQRLPKSPSPGSITVERAESGVNTIPVDGELRRYFASNGMSEEQTAASVRRFANNVVDRSSQVLQHAWALKRLTERFSPDELRNLSPEARAYWLVMIGEHCRVLQQANATLRQELQPIFFSAVPADNAEEGIEIKNDGDLVSAAERLLGICTSNHKLLSAAFTVSSDSSNAAAIRSPQFLRSLRSAEKLSARIGAAAR